MRRSAIAAPVTSSSIEHNRLNSPPELAVAIDSVVLAIQHLESVLGGDPPTTIKEALARYRTPSETSDILHIWIARRAAIYLREVARGDGLIEGVTQEMLRGAYHILRSYQYGNASPDLAKEMADLIGQVFPRATTFLNVEPNPPSASTSTASSTATRRAGRTARSTEPSCRGSSSGSSGCTTISSW